MLIKNKPAQTENVSKDKNSLSYIPIIEKAMKGDRRALYELCEINAKGVLFRATLLLGNQSDAEDVTQEVLIRVCEKIRDLREPKAFKVWLGSIITNESRRYMSKNARNGATVNIDDYLDSILEDKDDVLPQAYAENEESRKAVMEIIMGLPPRQKQAVLLHYYDGLNVTETAEAMGVTKSNVTQCLAAARDKLKYKLNDKSFAGGNVSALSVMPIGSFFTDVLNYESMSFAPVNPAFLKTVLAGCGKHIFAGPFGMAAKAGAGWVTGTAVTAATVTAVVFGVYLGQSVPVETQPQPHEVSVDGRLIFTGGVDNGRNSAYVNPEHAEPYVISTGGKVETLQWWITAAGSDAIVFEGDGEDLNGILLHMKETGMDGMYMLFFRVRDEAGAVHRQGRGFFIQIDEVQ